MASAKHPDAYVRLARPSEVPAITRVLTRAFAKDPAMNWYGCVPELVPDCESQTPSAQRSMRNLSWFQSAILKSTVLVKGLVTVVVVPSVEDGEDAEQESNRDTVEAREEVVAVALWLPPGKTLDMGPVTFLRSGIMKVIQGWGLTGAKRVLWDFSPAVERTLEKAFKARGLDRLDSWHLFEMVVDPSHQGRGYSSLLMEEGFRRTSPKPVHLEATTAKNRDIYAHFGFEVDEEHQFGVGAVDKDGIRARGKAATGYPEWVMTKVCSLFHK